MNDLRVEARRDGVVESVHRIAAVALRPDGATVAWSGDPNLVTFWRSAAKPFQAMPLVEDGVLDRFALGDDALALACASHSSEPVHLDLAARFLAGIGCTESDLACGPHPPLGPQVAREVVARGTRLTPRWSNCSGKHAGMLGLARHHGWPIPGYERRGHPVQARILEAVTAWTGLAADQLAYGVDGCTTVCFGLPLRNMALAYARLGTSPEPAAARVRGTMMAHPHLVAGEGRLCTELMRAWPGRIVVKVGADGVYCAALPELHLGMALKVEDGDISAAPIALLAVLEGLFGRLDAGWAVPDALRARWAERPIANTRDQIVGAVRAAGALRFSDSG